MAVVFLLIGVVAGVIAIRRWNANPQATPTDRLKAARIAGIFGALCLVVALGAINGSPGAASQDVAAAQPTEVPPTEVPEPSSSPEPAASPTPDGTGIPTVGDEYTFRYAPLCVDDYKVFDKISEAQAKNDDEGAAEFLQGHEVDVTAGTRVRVLNSDIFRSDVDVRVTSTDSDAYGEEMYCLVKTNSGSQPLFQALLKRV
jgi:hypothetical protein